MREVCGSVLRPPKLKMEFWYYEVRDHNYKKNYNEQRRVLNNEKWYLDWKEDL
jgi:hypothetical protein